MLVYVLTIAALKTQLNPKKVLSLILCPVVGLTYAYDLNVFTHTYTKKEEEEVGG
jgi:hypothetical protein